MISPRAMPGRKRSRCSSLPKAWIGYMARADWTEQKLRMPLSWRSSSIIVRP
jgi:hypothetical protein